MFGQQIQIQEKTFTELTRRKKEIKEKYWKRKETIEIADEEQKKTEDDRKQLEKTN